MRFYPDLRILPTLSLCMDTMRWIELLQSGDSLDSPSINPINSSRRASANIIDTFINARSAKLMRFLRYCWTIPTLMLYDAWTACVVIPDCLPLLSICNLFLPFVMSNFTVLWSHYFSPIRLTQKVSLYYPL